MQKFFTRVNNKPFFSLGGQCHNSSAYIKAELETAIKAVKTLHGNTIEVPVYWEQIEPQEGHFELGIMDELLAAARENKLKLIILWFGTWKNGMMRYTPEWVKKDATRFKRVISSEGLPVTVLSSHCKKTLEADKKAFCALMEYIRLKDSAEQTIIAVQVENEPGILGSDRDYSKEADKEFNSPVLQMIVNNVKNTPNSVIHTVWVKNGSKPTGSWPELFGDSAGEFFTACSIATFIDTIAAAGKNIYNIPMYANAWLSEQEWRTPGLNYPSGGPNTINIDLWKWLAPHLDLVVPDIYFTDSKKYYGMCKAYNRSDNQLFIPESSRTEANALYMFSAIADYNTVGFHIFGVEDILAPDGTPRSDCLGLIGSFRSVSAALPLITEHYGTGSIYAVVQEENMPDQYFDFGDYIGLVKFYKGGELQFQDYHHFSRDHDYKNERGRGLIIHKGAGEFYVLGAGYRLMLKKKGSFKQMTALYTTHPMLEVRLNNYIKVEEGYFDSDGNWIATRKRNGDESDYGIWVHYDVGVVHVVAGE